MRSHLTIAVSGVHDNLLFAWEIERWTCDCSGTIHAVHGEAQQSGPIKKLDQTAACKRKLPSLQPHFSCAGMQHGWLFGHDQMVNKDTLRSRRV